MNDVTLYITLYITLYTTLSLIYIVSGVLDYYYLAWRLNTMKAEIREKRSLENKLREMLVYYQGAKPLGFGEEE